MKIENIAIMCKDLNQRDEAEKVLINHGLTNDNYHTGNKNITVGEGQVFWFSDFSAGSKISFEEFMQRYSKNKMIKKIHQAKKELGLNNSELSLRMGKSRPYIAKMLNQPQSEKVQNKVIAEIDRLIDGNLYDQYLTEKQDKFNKEFKKDLRDLHEKIISHLSDGAKDPDLFISNLDDEFKLKDKEISDLKKTIESKDLAISGLIKQNDEAKKIHDIDSSTLDKLNEKHLELVKKNHQTEKDRGYFANQYKQSESDVNSLKSKIKRERIIILIVIVILTALFFLKGSIGG
ncbi:transcriptional regulator [Acinetobacter phage Cato]|nr:transcriptional regulator [Acinetobacter phage Cato]